MIDIHPDLKQWLLDRKPHLAFDLWTFALTSGITLRWTSADVDLAVGGQTYLSEIAITRDKCKLTTGLETATQMVTISPRAGAAPLIGGIPMRQAVRCGLFDGARTRLEWVYYQPGTPSAATMIGAPILRFTGSVGEIDAYAAKATITVNSPLKRLDLQIPWKAYGAGCRYVLGDLDCGVDLTAYGEAGAVLSGSSNGMVETDMAADDGAWAGGTLVLTSGDDATFRRTIRTNVGGTLSLKTPLPWAPEAGDMLTVYPGCNKTKPDLGSVSVTATIPGGLTVSAATSDTFGADMGVTMIGMTHTSGGEFLYYGEGGAVYAPVITTKDADTAMIKVTGTPATGQYALAGNVYTFATADIDREVVISASTMTGGEGGCRRFSNVALFGGMPFIPSPETAY
jgi:uncharacterized phage protein (TIGR02218 family)